MSLLRRRLGLYLGLLLACGGCRSKSTAGPEEGAAPAPTGSSAPTPPPELHPVASAALEAALNPAREKPYSGPIGAVRGVVHSSGDPAPDLPELLAKIPAGKCDDARAFYGKLFREGPNHELGDVLVAVTEYKGFIPAPSDTKVVVARGCAFQSRTIAMTFGQHLGVKNRGGETFIPRLMGAPQAALVVAMPGGDPVMLFPPHPGQFLLQDATHEFALADVFVLKYPTVAVTGLDGVFEIKDIPAGDVLVSALLPATSERVSARIKIMAGETASLDLTIPFDAAKHPAQAAPSASAK